MFTKRRIVLLGVAGLAALGLFASLAAGVFAQAGSTPTPAAMQPMMPVATPGARTHEMITFTVTMPMTHEQVMRGMEAVTPTLPMTREHMMPDMSGSHDMEAMTSTVPMTMTGPYQSKAAGDRWGMGYHGSMAWMMPMMSVKSHQGGMIGCMCARMDGSCPIMSALDDRDNSTAPGTVMDDECSMMGDGDDAKGQMGATDTKDGEESDAGTTRLSPEEVASALDDYLALNYEPFDFKLADLLEFGKAFYARMRETMTGANAFELTVDPYRGAVNLEQGPGTMWNAKYGQQGGMAGLFSQGGGGEGFGQVTASDMPVTPDQARKNAQSYLSARRANLKVGEPQAFYGYYTFPLINVDDKLVGLISVNGYTGRVWHHAWLGKFIGPAEMQ